MSSTYTTPSDAYLAQHHKMQANLLAIGTSLRDLRTTGYSISLEEFAHRVGCPVDALKQIEEGNPNVPIGHVGLVLEFINAMKAVTAVATNYADGMSAAMKPIDFPKM